MGSPDRVQANEPLFSGGICECGETEQYTVTVSPPVGGTGTVTVSPEKQLYAKGEVVSVCYEVGELEEFDFWTCDPPSNTASDCFLPTVIFQVTGNTTLTPVVRGPATLVFWWDPHFGDVNIPGGAELIGDVEDRKTYRLVAKPLTGVELTGTANQGYEATWSQYYGKIYESSVTIPLFTGTQQYECLFVLSSQMPSNMETFTVSVSGAGEGTDGGYVRMADTSGPGGGNGAPYLTSSVRVASEATMHCWPDPFHVFLRWAWDGGQQACPEDGCLLTRSTSAQQRAFTAHIAEKVFLIIQLEGQGVVTGNNLRFGYNPESNTPVTLHAEPVPRLGLRPLGSRRRPRRLGGGSSSATAAQQLALLHRRYERNQERQGGVQAA